MEWESSRIYFQSLFSVVHLALPLNATSHSTRQFGGAGGGGLMNQLLI